MSTQTNALLIQVITRPSVLTAPSTNVEKFGILSGGPAVLTRDYADTTTSDIIVVNLMIVTK
jgi:hypothetical protein